MKKIILSLMVLVAAASCQEQQKIAFVDNTKVVNEFNKKKDFEAKFKTKIEKFNKKADSLQQMIQVEAQAFQTRAAKIGQAKAEEEYNALVQKKQMQDYQLGSEEKALQTEGQAQIDSLVKEVKEFIKDYGKTNGYTYILGANEAGSVLYGTDANDITEEVLESLNKKSETKTEE
ncbi:periplasmic chaperone for outer membrane proteins Skp [Winogradskyella epiphytica]|uniref:Periplasmic chaperone for outer membrane proteins Skp n=1 Tax=Winogradskyella epiphytica TaxID=262005 RepID=A0A2V4XMK8_9FLAO|nr:OmpH family outer membrane protein [Winogradskyella epiphytica]PYE83309.1 periplasmic chaperone for outer membrane proteins Skp [Winogradskyella epiphytica]GGW57226.1 membrane protein [Winogradskyella epiphytica]